MRVYTRTGDKGETSLASGKRVPKYHPRLEAYGSVDELNSHIGLLRAEITDSIVQKFLIRIQNRVFSISSRLALENSQMTARLPEIKDSDINELEIEIDCMLDLLPPLKNFIIPGGHIQVAQCHVARTVCRRVERIIVHLAEEIEVDENMIIYINRLSDYFFALARKMANDLDVQEIVWTSDYE